MTEKQQQQQQQQQQLYKDEIAFLKKQAVVTLQQVETQETFINTKQGKIDIDVRVLQDLIEKQLRILALIDTYRYFQRLNKSVTNGNNNNNNKTHFLLLFNDNYTGRLKRFVKDLTKQNDQNWHMALLYPFLLREY